MRCSLPTLQRCMVEATGERRVQLTGVAATQAGLSECEGRKIV